MSNFYLRYHAYFLIIENQFCFKYIKKENDKLYMELMNFDKSRIVFLIEYPMNGNDCELLVANNMKL